ncbi:Zinc finger, DBF-type [Metarhizium robertsii ARSEF 23]|uniref:Zinc finger, DBF-type n=2 Tax=Metarhizium robertsii TaxID=568076 RepID=E9EQ23_METRA|nr:Zinc finger, DBF-type [Metarhizium robertsii ARSEF 23]EFZ02487.1 Zinc finger, DBF-type [Metarhizium robertsii ARSEF 23]
MAAISLSPTPAPIAAMSSRRVPLTSNPNVANSPLRGPGSLHAYAKQKRSYANVQREEAYGQPPPVKKQVLEDGTQRAVRSPSKAHRTQVVVQRSSTRLVAKDRATRTTQVSTRTVQDVDTEKEVWKKHHRAKFPKMVFYFESIPDDIRAKLTKRVNYLGARQEPFFSIDITHVVTTRSIPPEKSGTQHEESLEQEQQEPEEQPQTINPSLLDRNTAAGRRKLLFDFRQTQIPSQQADDPTRRTKGTRNNDVLHKAREMGKKIWSLDKFQNMLAVLLESETRGATYASGTTSVRSQYGVTKGSHEPNLLQLLHNERLNGPSDRDPTAVNRELVYFKGPYIYVWDMDDKYKPIMVREYAKAVNKQDGEWPQFRSVGNGRCPFVEEIEIPEKEQRRNREREKDARLVKREDPVPILKPPEIPIPKPVTGKRTLTEMEDGQNRVRTGLAMDVFNPAKAVLSKQAELKSQNAFTSRAEGTRLFAGEPVASGMQPSNVTSAIRSQMISSTSGINGGKAGTSKEVHGLQRKVLQKANPASHDVSSRRFAEVSMDVASSRSTTMSRQTSKAVQPHDDESQRTECREKKSNSQSLKSKRDLKPGYCENCQDKFPDFDEHILSRKHRKFAENDDNWTELDLLLEQLKRMPKYAGAESDNDDNGW